VRATPTWTADEDRRRAAGELAWLVTRDDAQRLHPRRVWLDPDLHTGQARVGWIEARMAAEAIQLLDELTVDELSTNCRCCPARTPRR
jgi:hypothetical protein